MSKNNRRPEYVAKLPKTDHNLSHKVKFSSSVGHLLPVFHHILNPGENLKVDLSLFTRTQPLVTAAMVDIQENVDFYFVPFPLLFTGFEAQMYGTSDFLSSYVATHSDDRWFPLLNTVMTEAERVTCWQRFLDETDNGWTSGVLSASRLLAHLHYNFMMPFDGIEYEYLPDQTRVYNDGYQPTTFPYALMAYHAIYYDFFCLQDFESRRVGNYNWDLYTGDASVKAKDLPSNFFKLHYVAYDGDYFTNSYPTPLLSSANLSTDMLDNSQFADAMRLYLGDANNVTPAQSDGMSTVYPEDFSQVSANGSYDFTLATNQLRANFAVEKYLRVLGRADKTYDAQVLARFGFHVPTDIKHQVQHIGHHSQEIKIGEVVATAQTYDGTSGASLGEIAGKGYGIDKRKNMVDFTAPCHGVVMAVYHAKPVQIYNRFGFDRINWITSAQSFWDEAYDALGAQPIFNLEAASPINGPLPIQSENIFTWSDRYHEFKNKFSWTTPAFASPDQNGNPELRLFNQWNSWINGASPLRYDQMAGTEITQNLAGRLVHPDDLDEIFTVPFVKEFNDDFIKSPWLMYQGDPFLHDLDFKITLWSPMSKTGEPRMDF